VAGTAARPPSISHSKQFSPRQPNCSLVVEKFGLAELHRLQANADGRQLREIADAKLSVEKLINRLKTERIIDFLSGAHWLPGYAFPQDVIRLLVRQKDWTDRMRLERDREVGISEYAPGAEVIADGHLFTSRGVIPKGQSFDIRKYRYCMQCRRLATATENEELGEVCECGKQSPIFNYIKPEGFQTFYNDRVVEQTSIAPGRQRTRSCFS